MILPTVTDHASLESEDTTIMDLQLLVLCGRTSRLYIIKDTSIAHLSV